MSPRDQIEEAWIVGCGACGYDTILKTDLSIELRVPEKPWCPVAAEPCADCRHTQETGDEHYNEGNLYEEAVTHLMGWCGCGAPEEATELVMRFLQLTKSWDEPNGQEERDKRRALCGSDGAFYIVAYLADALNWTEHGGSVGGEWLTDTGRAALARWEAHVGSVV